MIYRDRDTGRLMSASKARGRRGGVAVPADDSRWGAMALDAMNVDRVVPSIPPKYDSSFQTVDGSGVEEVDGELYQVWVVVDREIPVGRRRDIMYSRVQTIVDNLIEEGVILVEGVPIKASTEGLSRVTGAKNAGRAERTYVFGKKNAVKLSQAQVDEMFTAIDDFFEAIYSRQAELISLITESEDPESIDIDTGWPNE